MDIQGDLDELLKDGKSLAEASAEIVNKYSFLNDDSDEAPLLWIALADSQWKYGGLEPGVLERVKHDFDADAGMGRWQDEGESNYRKRRVALQKFINKIETPKPKPTRLPRHVI